MNGSAPNRSDRQSLRRPPVVPLDDAVGAYVNGPINGSIVINDQGQLVLDSGLAAPVGLIPLTSSLIAK
jgi:hypothetical protein